MANHKSAQKRARQIKTRTMRNRSQESAVKTAIKNLYKAVDAKDKKTATGLLVNAQSLLDRLAKNGIIKGNTAARKTSRLAAQISKL